MPKASLWDNWKKEVAIEQDEDKRRLKELEKENARLTELSLDHGILKERVYRVWKAEELHLRSPAKRPGIKRTYQELLPPDQINEGWAIGVRN